MSLVVETRDPYTAGHERRVAELATAIAAEMGMEGEALAALRLAGLIHDIGKIAVPAEILSKPGRLSAVEFNLIKQHPEAGFDILGAIDFGLPVAELVLQHHERLDGSGYPRGLAGEDVLPRGPHPRRRRRRRGDEFAPPLSRGPRHGGGPRRGPRARRGASTTPRSWRPACASSRSRASRSRREVRAGGGQARCPQATTPRDRLARRYFTRAP